MTAPLENKLAKGDYAIAHIQSSGYSLLAGHYGYSRFFVVQITKATRDGEAKAFTDWNGNCSRPVDRKVTIYSYPKQFASTAAAAFAKQECGFCGYHDKAELKAALEALATQVAA